MRSRYCGLDLITVLLTVFAAAHLFAQTPASVGQQQQPTAGAGDMTEESLVCCPKQTRWAGQGNMF
jgi:hypothetical protein